MKTHYFSKSEKSTSKVCFYLCFDRFQRFFNSKTAGFPCYVDVDLSVKNRYFFEPQNVDLSGCRLKCENYRNFEFRKHSPKTRFPFVSDDFTITFLFIFLKKVDISRCRLKCEKPFVLETQKGRLK